jgi:hypothetical protein
VNITKTTQTLKATREELEQINSMTRRELEEEQLYLFSVRLCDNEVDRDGERFTTETLQEPAPMFVGKSGIFDHQWSAHGQSARLYKCEVVTEPARLNQAGEVYCWLKGYAYMLRSPGSEQLIAEIDAGIKKEVSVGCSVAKKTCSICGADVTGMPCEHRKGERYDGKVCHVMLEGAKDAYEFSFVAVPAQPAAGVVKGMESPCGDLKQLVRRHPACEKQLEALEQEAALGRNYLKQLKDDVVRLGLLAGLGLECSQLREMANTLYPSQLEQLKQAYGRQAGKFYPMPTQLSYGEKLEEDRQLDEAFLI